MFFLFLLIYHCIKIKSKLSNKLKIKKKITKSGNIKGKKNRKIVNKTSKFCDIMISLYLNDDDSTLL